MTMKVRQFNEEGLALFRDYLVGLRADPALPPPFEYLEDDGLTTHVKGVAFVENVPIPTRMDAAKYLKQALQNLDPDEFDNNNMWAWLSLFFFDQLCPLNTSGKRKAGMEYRYIPTSEFRGGRHRHLLKIPFQLYKDHGNSARLLLHNSIDKPGDFNEQISNRQNLVANRAVIEALDVLFFDTDKGCPKKGVIDKTRKQLKAGTLNRFWKILNQLELTHDLFSLNNNELLELLPAEFYVPNPTFLASK